MSVLSKIGKVLSIAAPIAAIPFTGGLSALGLGATAAGTGAKILSGIGAAGGALSNLGSVAGNAAKGSADQRIAEGNQAVQYGNMNLNAANDKATQDRANAQAGFDSSMKSADFNRTGQDRSLKNAVSTQVLNNVKDATIGGLPSRIKVPTISGGLRPSVLTNNNSALMAQLAQPQIDAPTYNAPAGYQAPTLPTMPTAGAGEKILGGVGLGSSILGAIGAGLPPNGGMEQMPTFKASPIPKAPDPNMAAMQPSPGLMAPSDAQAEQAAQAWQQMVKNGQVQF